MTDHSMPSKNYKEEKSREPIFVIQSEPAGGFEQQVGSDTSVSFNTIERLLSFFFLILQCVTIVTETEEGLQRYVESSATGII